MSNWSGQGTLNPAPAGMLASAVISAFRADALVDTTAITDAQALRWLDDGHRLMVGDGGVRRDLLLQSDGTRRAVGAIAALTDALAVGPEWRAALADYLIYRYVSTLDSNDANQKEAARRLKAFEGALGVRLS